MSFEHWNQFVKETQEKLKGGVRHDRPGVKRSRRKTSQRVQAEMERGEQGQSETASKNILGTESSGSAAGSGDRRTTGGMRD